MRGQAAFGAALLRVMLGVIFIMHGYYALVVLGPGAVAGFTTRMGYPAQLASVLAWYLIVAHVFGGMLMIVGFLTRWAALAQIPIMASAVFLLHLRQGFFMRGIIVDATAGRAIAGGYEYALLVLVATVAVVLLGPGVLSIDRR
jgi:putative oxidoreductase